MPKAIKWILSIVVAIVVLIVAAIIIVPMVVDLEKYKPWIETKVSDATGRPFTLGGKIEPSVFPWAGVALSDLHLGNPPGFKEKDFVSIEAFEVRLKLLSLLFGKIEVKRFVVRRPHLVLEKDKDGRASWQGLGQKSTPPGPKAEPAPVPKPEGDGALPIKDIVVGEFAVTDGRILIIDHAAGSRKEVKEINLILTDVSLDKPIGLDFSAVADEHPLSLNGKVGPLGPEPGKSPLTLLLVAKLLSTLEIQVQGRIDNPTGGPQFDLAIQIEPFSLRSLMAEIDQPMPYEPADKQVLTNIALAMKVKGTPDSVGVSDGKLTLDDSQMTFSAQAKDFNKPDLKMRADLDGIDIDRYLPPPSKEKDKPAGTKKERPEAKPAKKTDYTPLRKLVLDAGIKVGQLKAKNLRMQNVQLKVTAKDGILRLNPFSVDLYEGGMVAKGTFNVQRDTPRTTAKLNMKKVQAGPLLKDFLDKELIEGTMAADMNLKFTGDQPDQIRKTLAGQGKLLFVDGAIVGIDLANMVRNVQSAFGMGGKPTQKPRTDFAEFVLPFTIAKGLTRIDGTKLSSPLLRVLAGGTAHLSKETLDMRVEPKFVATLVGQGDTQSRGGVTVPVLISGTFSEPQFKPDLASMLTQQLPDEDALKKLIPTQDKSGKETDIGKEAQELLKGLPFGGNN